MSSMVYGALTGRRKRSPENKTTKEKAPGLGLWVDSFAAVVPAEVLVLHAYVLKACTDGTQITHKGALALSFYALLIACAVFYCLGQWSQGKWRIQDSAVWDRWDVPRLFIVELAFFGWMMAQKPSALDAAWPMMPDILKIIGLPFLAVFVGAFGLYLQNQANRAEIIPNDNKAELGW